MWGKLFLGKMISRALNTILSWASSPSSVGEPIVSPTEVSSVASVKYGTGNVTATGTEGPKKKKTPKKGRPNDDGA